VTAGRHAARRDPAAAREARFAQRAALTDPAPVIEAAAQLLSVRPRSVAETRRRLLRLGYPPAPIESAIGRLTELGFLDDVAFAEAWLASRDRSRPRGASALRQELTRLGVDIAVVRAALESRDTAAAGQPVDPDAPAPPAGGADRAAATRLLDRRLPALRREPDPRKRRQRAYALLARNGLAPDICRDVAAGALGDGEPDG
jgi:regulatory protein